MFSGIYRGCWLFFFFNKGENATFGAFYGGAAAGSVLSRRVPLSQMSGDATTLKMMSLKSYKFRTGNRRKDRLLKDFEIIP